MFKQKATNANEESEAFTEVNRASVTGRLSMLDFCPQQGRRRGNNFTPVMRGKSPIVRGTRRNGDLGNGGGSRSIGDGRGRL